MSVFGAYARYYDLLYVDKQYAAEADYVERLLRQAAPDATTVLDFGCGTAVHASMLARRGYTVTGVDLSDTMLAGAERRLATLSDDTRGRLRLVRGDIRTASLGRTFDVVVSLFHVVSYQTAQCDLEQTFANARAHLAEGGVFLFDFWYGPAVLTDRPAPRTRRLEDDRIDVVRDAEPVMRPNDDVVDVHFRVRIRDKATGAEEELRELHPMRYLFLPELGDLLGRNGFAIERAEEWMTGNVPGFDTWNVCVVARAM